MPVNGMRPARPSWTLHGSMDIAARGERNCCCAPVLKPPFRGGGSGFRGGWSIHLRGPTRWCQELPNAWRGVVRGVGSSHRDSSFWLSPAPPSPICAARLPDACRRQPVPSGVDCWRLWCWAAPRCSFLWSFARPFGWPGCPTHWRLQVSISRCCWVRPWLLGGAGPRPCGWASLFWRC